jgi:hypothetical protein
MDFYSTKKRSVRVIVVCCVVECVQCSQTRDSRAHRRALSARVERVPCSQTRDSQAHRRHLSAHIEVVGFHHTKDANGRGRESIFALHHGQRRLCFLVFQILSAHSPHCRAC